MATTRVLLCDDVESVRLLVRTQIALAEDLEIVAEARNGREAIDLAHAHLPDVVILDLAMPVLDGFAALPLITEVAPSSKVIVLSDLDGDQMAPITRSLGAAAYLEKEHALGDIVDRIRRC